MKHKIAVILICMVLCLLMLPVSAFAADEGSTGGGTTVNGIITLTPADLVDGASGEGWRFADGKLTIESGYTLVFDGECSVTVDNDGTFSGGTFNSKVKNDGTISGGTFDNNVTNQGTITNGIFSGAVINNDTISGGTFSGFVVNNTVYAVISNGTFSGDIDNYGTISGGTFSGDIDNYAYIEGGSFRCDIDGIADIPGVTLIHSPGTEWKSDGTNHWHECSCGAKADSAAHSGGTATCTEKAKCTVCTVEYGELVAHTYGTEWKSDGTNHWRECSCGAKEDSAAHVYDNDKDADCNTCGYERAVAAKTCIVTFNANGGTGTMAPQTFTEGVAQGLTANAFTREGFAFIGWNTAADGSGNAFADGATVTASSDVILYAQWKAVPALPQTGDSSRPMLWLAMSILSMAGILLLRKKAYSR